MISIGKNIRSSMDSLEKSELKSVYDKIWMPDSDLQPLVAQLRKMRQLDVSRYKECKKELPYIVCGIFNPPFRKTENFAYTEYFAIDIDNLSEKQQSLEDIKQRMKADDRVVMAFTSPSEDGLKLIFRLKERCYDSGLYSMFYKVFARKFSEQYGLEQVVDTRTCDVSRACFLSWDPDAYFNPDATPVDLTVYADVNNPALLFDEFHKAEAAERETEPEKKDERPKDPDDDALAKIKSLLNPRYTTLVSKRDVFVPEILGEIIGDMTAFLGEMGLEVYDVVDINYGKKLKIKVGHKLAELNVFYGKRGFSVVESPKNGTDDELNGVAAEAVIMFINTKL